jgi:hypothetical protein
VLPAPGTMCLNTLMMLNPSSRPGTHVAGRETGRQAGGWAADAPQA